MTNKKRKRKGLTIKIPKRELETMDVDEKLKRFLKKNSEYAYTRAGLLVELYNYKSEDLNAPFKDWPKGAPAQYSRIRRALKKLEDEGGIESKKQGKRYLYWWKDTLK
jgi:hypothetical protein